MIRATTNGVLKGYRSNLSSSFIHLNKARDMVLSQRNFTSYAEDPAGAAQSFQLRRSFSRVASYSSNNTSTARKFDTAWSTLDSISDSLKICQRDIQRAANDPTGQGRVPLGKNLIQLADSIVYSMNGKYGESFVFAGADGMKVPLTWKETNGKKELCYRNVNVTTGDAAKLQQMVDESRYVDVGLGLQEDDKGNLITASAFNDSISALQFLGYGEDGDGDSKNLVSQLYEMGRLLTEECSESGMWTSEQAAEDFNRLAGKFTESCSTFNEAFVDLDVKSKFLTNNEQQLKANAYALNEQLLAVEQVDLADAITSFSWAQYSYNAALKAGNSILSQSLMDYMN